VFNNDYDARLFRYYQLSRFGAEPHIRIQTNDKTGEITVALEVIVKRPLFNEALTTLAEALDNLIEHYDGDMQRLVDSLPYVIREEGGEMGNEIRDGIRHKLPEEKVKLWSELLESLQGWGSDLELSSYRAWRIVTGDRDWNWIANLTQKIKQCVEGIMEDWLKLEDALEKMQRQIEEEEKNNQ